MRWNSKDKVPWVIRYRTDPILIIELIYRRYFFQCLKLVHYDLPLALNHQEVSSQLDIHDFSSNDKLSCNLTRCLIPNDQLVSR